MRKRSVGSVVDGVRTLFEVGTLTGLSDGQLLDRYLRTGDDSAEAAFRALVDRHGPMVLRACRGILRDLHAAEDAFQATFLILARKGGSIQKRDSVASWLFGVARRVAIRSDARRRRQSARERQGVAMDGTIDGSHQPPESFADIQAEVDRLPERYRSPIVLCYLEGLTQEEAAIRLKLPPSTVRVRLMRARARLHDRLTRRGLAPGSLSGLAVGRAEWTMPAPLVDETIKAAIRIAAGRASGVAAPVAALAEGVIRTMFLAKLKTAAVLLAALTCASAGMIASIAGPAQAPPAQDPPAAEAPKTKPKERGREVAVETVRRSEWKRVTSQPATVASYGSVDVYPRISGYLHVVTVSIGQVVKNGDLLAQIADPGLAVAVQRARAEVERGNARVKKAGAAVRVAQAAAHLEHAKFEAADSAMASSRASLESREERFVRASQLVAQGGMPMARADDRKEAVESARTTLHTAEGQRKVAQAAEEEAKASVQMAEADLAETISERQIAEAGLREARIREGYARIVAPFDGVVTRVNYHDGALVRPPDQGHVEPIVTVVRSDIMLFVVDVPEADVAYLDRGDPVSVSIKALGEHGLFQGSVTRMAYALGSDRALRAEIVLSNEDGRLRPGLNGLAEIQLGTRENVLSIPITAVYTRLDNGYTECLCVRDGRATVVPIKIGEMGPGRVEVLEGLKEGDRVIAVTLAGIKDGMAVTPRPEKPPGR